jgi:hypothetical protein
MLLEGVNRQRPNPPFHPTPLRVDKIGSILSAKSSYTVISIYQWWRG